MDFLQRLGDLDAAAFAAPAGVNLRLDDPDLSAELARSRIGLIATEKQGTPRGRRDAESSQYFLALVFVNIHDLD